MVFNTTFNNISATKKYISLDSFIDGRNHRLVVSHWQTYSHNVVSSTPRNEWDSILQH